jgi:hypothetical protein
VIAMITGPQLRDRVRIRCDAYAQYAYVDEDGKPRPEYAATHIAIRAYFADMNPELLVELEEKLAALPGCLSTEQIVPTGRRDTRRSQVYAVFDRRVAAE